MPVITKKRKRTRPTATKAVGASNGEVASKKVKQTKVQQEYDTWMKTQRKRTRRRRRRMCRRLPKSSSTATYRKVSSQLNKWRNLQNPVPHPSTSAPVDALAQSSPNHPRHALLIPQPFRKHPSSYLPDGIHKDDRSASTDDSASFGWTRRVGCGQDRKRKDHGILTFRVWSC